jgi:hypothetical protein
VPPTPAPAPTPTAAPAATVPSPLHSSPVEHTYPPKWAAPPFRAPAPHQPPHSPPARAMTAGPAASPPHLPLPRANSTPPHALPTPPHTAGPPRARVRAHSRRGVPVPPPVGRHVRVLEPLGAEPPQPPQYPQPQRPQRLLPLCDQRGRARQPACCARDRACLLARPWSQPAVQLHAVSGGSRVRMVQARKADVKGRTCRRSRSSGKCQVSSVRSRRMIARADNDQHDATVK